MKNNLERSRIAVPSEIANKIRAEMDKTGKTWTNTIIDILNDYFVNHELRQLLKDSEGT